jgi:hypothetical protein
MFFFATGTRHFLVQSEPLETIYVVETTPKPAKRKIRRSKHTGKKKIIINK